MITLLFLSTKVYLIAMHFQNLQCFKSAFMNNMRSWYILFSNVMQPFTCSCPWLRVHLCCQEDNLVSWSSIPVFQNKQKPPKNTWKSVAFLFHHDLCIFTLAGLFSGVTFFIFWHYTSALLCMYFTIICPRPAMQCV